MIELGKQYRTRDGREVRVLMTDGGDWNFPVIAAYKDKDGRWWPLHLTANGRTSLNPAVTSSNDLIEVKPRIQRKVWLNLYPLGSGWASRVHGSKADADDYACHPRIACVEIDIDVEEGHGL